MTTAPRHRPLRVAIVTAFPERLGGSDNILWAFLRHSDRNAIEPMVVFRGEGTFEREVADLGIRTAVVGAGRVRNPAHMASSVVGIARILRSERPDLILNWLSTAQLYGAPAAALAGMADRCVWWQLDLHSRDSPRRGRIFDRLATVLPARAIGGCSEAVAAAQAGLWPHRPTFAVLPGVDPPDVLPEPELNALRRRLGIPPDGAIVGIVGRLFAWKGHHRLLDALAIVRDAGRGVHGLFVGGGGHRADARYESFLRDRARDLSLDGQVTFTGQVRAPGPYLQLMDVFVNASTREPFGLVLIEAMSMGVPVVAVDAAGPREIVEPDRSGLLAPTDDPRDLAAKIRLLLDDPALRERIRREGKARFESRFKAEGMAREMDRKLAALADSAV